MKLSTKFIAVCCLLMPAVHAQATEYDFEIIVFEDKSGRYQNSEFWQQELSDPGPSSIEARQSLTRNAQSDAASNVKQIGGIGLKRYASKLKSNKRYNVLVHKAWRQTEFQDDAAVEIPINSRTVSSPDEATNSIEGSIKIVLGRYLHIYTDMLYQQPNPEYNPGMYGEDSQPFKHYPIKSHRRMRSKELHYLDHPLVGILVMAMPVEKENT